MSVGTVSYICVTEAKSALNQMKSEETSGLSCFIVKMLNAGAKLFQFVDDIRSCLKNYFLMNRF